jgi:hypothetical protein
VTLQVINVVYFVICVNQEGTGDTEDKGSGEEHVELQPLKASDEKDIELRPLLSSDP